MTEENENKEDKEEPKEEKPKVLAEANKVAEELKAELAKADKAIVELKERLAIDALGGRTDGDTDEKPKEETPQQYKDRIMKG